MKIIEINGGVFGSTGKIMFDITDKAKMDGMEVICASPITSTNRFNSPNRKYYKIGNYWGRKISVFFGRITGYSGCFSVISTLKFIFFLKREDPDIIH